LMLAPPLIAFEAIELRDLNRCLVAWDHKMGPWNRPTHRGWFHGLLHNGRIVAVAAAGDLIRETCAGLTRSEALELARMCAERPNLNRVALRLWREFVLPGLAARHGWSWAVSYQDAALHSGNLYRFDGWAKLGESSSGTDKRSGRRCRRKVIWGWHLAGDPVAAWQARGVAA
jgi:hypothetical protein